MELVTRRCNVAAREARTRKDWVRWIEGRLTTRNLDAERVVLVMDHFNTHAFQPLYKAFPPTRVRALMQWLEIHPTLKHGRELKPARIELSGQSLNRCLRDLETFLRGVAAWEAVGISGTPRPTGTSPPTTPVPS